MLAKVFKNFISGSFRLVFILDSRGFPYVNKNRGVVKKDPLTHANEQRLQGPRVFQN